MEIRDKLQTLAAKFGIPGDVTDLFAVHDGHINSTYHVTIREGGRETGFFFQRVNVFVFQKPIEMMDNISRITAHIEKKLLAAGEGRDGVLRFVHRPNGENFLLEGDEFWRISYAVPDTYTPSGKVTPAVFRAAGAGFGRFQTLLSDFDAASLHETIPHFHDTKGRVKTFAAHLSEDPCARAREIETEAQKIFELSPLATRLCDFLEAGELPLRVTHNDTKINNILFDKNTNAAKTVIDLDTVMPGLVAHDFGDAIRYSANTAAEDEKDLSAIRLDMDLYRAFAEGFLGEVGTSLTEKEIDTLSLGALAMTFELAVRFFDDYLMGDPYFGASYPTHNLVRGRCQLRLAEDMLAHLDEMQSAVKALI